MRITDRIEPENYKELTEFLLAHEIKDIALKKLIEFVKEVSDNFSFNQSDEDALKKLVYFEQKAYELLEEFGETK